MSYCYYLSVPHRESPLARRNYGFEKYQKEQRKQQKKEEKERRKEDRAKPPEPKPESPTLPNAVPPV